MTIFNRGFRASWLMCFITVTGIALFVTLGLWQFERADYKQIIENKFETRLQADYVDFKPESNWSEWEYLKVSMQGQYLEAKTLLLDNQLENGRVGYHVVTPFELSGGELVLVNRGWVAMGESRQVLPAIEAVENANYAKGMITIPGDDIYRLGELSVGENWPQIIPFIDIAALQPEFENRLLPIVIWLGVEQGGAYLRNWQPVWLKPEKSRAYAWQWFAFALVALILFFVLNLRKLHD